MQDVIKSDFISRTSDPYAVFVFEDCCAKTEYISNCLSPIWPHKSQRAAKFNVTSPGSKVRENSRFVARPASPVSLY